MSYSPYSLCSEHIICYVWNTLTCYRYGLNTLVAMFEHITCYVCILCLPCPPSGPSHTKASWNSFLPSEKVCYTNCFCMVAASPEGYAVNMVYQWCSNGRRLSGREAVNMIYKLSVNGFQMFFMDGLISFKYNLLSICNLMPVGGRRQHNLP